MEGIGASRQAGREGKRNSINLDIIAFHLLEEKNFVFSYADQKKKKTNQNLKNKIKTLMRKTESLLSRRSNKLEVYFYFKIRSVSFVFTCPAGANILKQRIA